MYSSELKVLKCAILASLALHFLEGIYKTVYETEIWNQEAQSDKIRK